MNVKKELQFVQCSLVVLDQKKSQPKKHFSHRPQRSVRLLMQQLQAGLDFILFIVNFRTWRSKICDVTAVNRNTANAFY